MPTVGQSIPHDSGPGHVTVVTTTNDLVDGNTASMLLLNQNKGADGFVSLREAIIAIETLRVLRGGLHPRILGLVLEWAALHREQLDENWSLARAGLPLLPIDPLV